MIAYFSVFSFSLSPAGVAPVGGR